MTPPKLSIAALQAFLYRLHTNPFFEWTTITIIIVSSLNIGLKTYPLSPLAVNILLILDWLVTVYFLFEVIIRIIAAGGLRAFFRGGGWNIFDFTIVAVSLIPVSESDSVLLARLLRLFRVMRLIYFIPQLRILAGALIDAIPRIIYVALMMFVIFYLYGAVGTLMFAEINETLWGNIAIAMLTLFRVATFEDWTDVMYETMEVYPLSWLFYLTFIFLSAFVFLNMMIGVIIESLSESHAKEAKEAQDAKDAESIASSSQQEENIQVQLQRIDTRLRNIEEKLNKNA